MKPFTEEQKKIAETKFKELYPALSIGVRDHNDPSWSPPGFEESSCGVAVTQFVATFGWKEGMSFDVQVASAAIGIVDCAVKTIVPLAEPADILMLNKPLRDYVRQLAGAGELIHVLNDWDRETQLGT